MSIGLHCGAALRAAFVPGGLRWLPALALALAGAAHAQAWPSKPVRIVVPVSVGGTTDLLARLLGQSLSSKLGQPFVVEAKPGASGAIGSLEVARAPADGYTLLLATSSTHAVNPAVSTQLRYRPVEDFTPIAFVAEANNLLLVAPGLAARDTREMLALAKARPGALNYATSGNGSFSHLAFELLASQAQVALTHVPYKGTASAMTDLAGGAVHMTVDAISTGLPYVKDGRLRALAVIGPRRSPLAPDVPTIAESGVPGIASYGVLSWFGLYGPRGLPPQLAQRINDEVNQLLRSPEMVARFAALGIEPGKGTPADFAAMVAADTARWSLLAKEINLKVE